MLPLILACSLFAPTVQLARFSGDPLAMAWNSQGTRLFWVQRESEKKDVLHSWPPGKPWALPVQAKLDNDVLTQMHVNRSGTQILLTSTFGPHFLLDLKRRKTKEVRGEFVWWVGDQLAVAVNDRDLRIGSSRYKAPRDWRLASGAPGHPVVLAKDVRKYDGPVAIFRVGSKGKLQMIRHVPEIFYNEAIGQDSLAWNPKLGIAAAGLTADTASETAALRFFGSKVKEPDIPFGQGWRSLTSAPSWVDDKLVVSTYHQLDSSGGSLISGTVIHRLVCLDPRRGSYEVLREVRSRWSNEPVEYRGGDYLSMAAVSPNGLIAVHQSGGKKQEIVILKLRT